MSGDCKRLRPSLELYAEGELGDGRELRRVRRHLSACAVCRRFLARHDELTRRLLEDGADGEVLFAGADSGEPRAVGSVASSERAERIWGRIEELPLPAVESPRPAVSLQGALSAAALLLIALHLSGVLREPERHGPEVEVAGEFPLERSARYFVTESGSAADRRPGEAGARLTGRLAGKDGLAYLGDLRWVREPALASSFPRGAVARSERWMWLFATSRQKGSAGVRNRRATNVTLALAVERLRVPGEKERLLIVPEALLAGSARGRTRSEEGDPALPTVLEVTPRQLLELAVLSLGAEGDGPLGRQREDTAGSRRYRVLSLGSLDRPHAAVLEVPSAELVGWGLGRPAEPDPLDRWPAGALLGSGPRS